MELRALFLQIKEMNSYKHTKIHQVRLNAATTTSTNHIIKNRIASEEEIDEIE